MPTCKNCNKDFEGDFCPDCETKVEENADVEAVEETVEEVVEETATETVEETVTEDVSEEASDENAEKSKKEKKPNKFMAFMKKIGDFFKTDKCKVFLRNALLFAPYVMFMFFSLLIWSFFGASVSKRASTGTELANFYSYTFGSKTVDPSFGFILIFIFAILTTLFAIFMGLVLAVPKLRKAPIKWFGEYKSLSSIIRLYVPCFYGLYMLFGVIIAAVGASGFRQKSGACGGLLVVFSLIFLGLSIGGFLYERYLNKKGCVASYEGVFATMDQPKPKQPKEPKEPKQPKQQPVQVVYAQAPVQQMPVAQNYDDTMVAQNIPAPVEQTYVPEYDANTPRPVSKFKGGAFAYFFISLGCLLVSIITLFIAAPAMYCVKKRWLASKTIYDDKQLKFDGKGLQLFGQYIKWLLLSIITLGIYAIFCLPVAKQKWETKHTHFYDTDLNVEVRDETNTSYFDGGVWGLFGTKFVANFVTIITLGIGSFWARCYKERWFARHTIIDGERLYFNGTGLQYFGKKIVWMLLTIITFGIYSFWMNVKVINWFTHHTHKESNRILISGHAPAYASNGAPVANYSVSANGTYAPTYGDGASYAPATGNSGLVFSIIAFALGLFFTLILIVVSEGEYIYYPGMVYSGYGSMMSFFKFLPKLFAAIGMGLSIKQKKTVGIIFALIVLFVL